MDFLAHLLIRAILAVHLSVTYPLVQQTLLALRTAVLRAAWWRFSAVLLVWMISAVRVSITAHTDRNALTAAALPFSTAAALLTCRPGRVIPLWRKFMFLDYYFHNPAVALYCKADLRHAETLCIMNQCYVSIIYILNISIEHFELDLIYISSFHFNSSHFYVLVIFISF